MKMDIRVATLEDVQIVAKLAIQMWKSHTIEEFLKNKGYKQISLSVQKANYAVNMYRKTGFAVVKEHEEEYIMVCRL